MKEAPMRVEQCFRCEKSIVVGVDDYALFALDDFVSRQGGVIYLCGSCRDLYEVIRQPIDKVSTKRE